MRGIHGQIYARQVECLSFRNSAGRCRAPTRDPGPPGSDAAAMATAAMEETAVRSHLFLERSANEGNSPQPVCGAKSRSYSKHQRPLAV